MKIALESPNAQSGIQAIAERRMQEAPMDWRPEVMRIPSIFVVVVGHMLFETGYLVNDARNPLVWLGGLAIGVFIACSGYVHGLKDEFNKPGSLNRTIYWKFFKTRFLRLYIGYYLALLVIFIAKLLSGYPVVFSTGPLTNVTWPMTITPISLVLDLTCMWPLFTGLYGGIWPAGWFVSVMMILSLAYPFLRRLYSLNKNYLYLIAIVTLIARFYVIICVNANYAYFFPFAWTAEFSAGIMLGNRVGMKGGPNPPSASYQYMIIKMAARVWPLYLFHMAVIVFMTTYAPSLEFLIATLAVLILAEIFYRILEKINRKVGVKRKKPRPNGELYQK